MKVLPFLLGKKQKSFYNYKMHPSSTLLHAFQKPQPAGHIAALVREGHRHDDIFWHVQWDEQGSYETLYLGSCDAEAQHLLGRIFEALEEGHPLPQSYKSQFNLSLCLARGQKPYHDQNLVFFERLVEDGIIQHPANSQSSLKTHDALLALFSMSAYTGQLNLMRRIVDFVSNASLLLQAKSTINHFNPFDLAVRGGQIEIFNWLHTQFDRADWPHETISDFQKNKTLYHHAMKHLQQEDMFQALWDQGYLLPSDLLMDFLNDRPAYNQSDFVSLMRWMVEHEVELENEQQSALDILVRQWGIKNGKELADELIFAGANPHWSFSNTQKNIFMVSVTSNEEWIDYFLDFGVDVNAKNYLGQSALFLNILSSYGRLNSVSQKLIRVGAQLDVKDHQGNHLLDLIPLQERHLAQRLASEFQQQTLDQQTHVSSHSLKRARL